MLNPEISLNRRLPERIAASKSLSALAQACQPIVRGWRDAGGGLLKNLLSGTVLGHPLHPALTDVPVGAWTVTALLDLLEAGGRREVAGAADASLAVGLLGATAAIVTGFADWSDTDGSPRTLGMAHALLNGTAFAAYLAALGLRRSGRRRSGVALSLAGYGLVGFAAFLGGELAFNYQLGVKHTAEPLEPPADFVDVLAAADIEAGRMVGADAGGIPVLLLRRGEDIHAIAAACTHRGAPLAEGTLENGTCVRCPWHGSVFSFEDGSVLEGPATFPQARFETRIVAERIQVRAFHVPDTP